MNIELICEVCGKKFSRKKGEVNRNNKKGRRTFCSLSCCGKGTLNNIPEEKRLHPENLQQRKIDEFSPFRFHLKIIRSHCAKKKKEYDITVKDLKQQWEKQCGKCPYTGWILKTPIDTSQDNQLPKTPDRASLDRIDSSKPYTKDNIQFVSMMAQFAKNTWPEEELIKFCKAVAEHTNA